MVTLDNFANLTTSEKRAISLALFEAVGNELDIKDEDDCEILDELSEELDNVDDLSDFTLEIDGCEYRIIDADKSDYVAVEELTEQLPDIYYDVEKSLENAGWLNDFISVDWKAAAEFAVRSDGAAHHFASYNGEEIACRVLNVNLYRTN